MAIGLPALCAYKFVFEREIKMMTKKSCAKRDK